MSGPAHRDWNMMPRYLGPFAERDSDQVEADDFGQNVSGKYW